MNGIGTFDAESETCGFSPCVQPTGSVSFNCPGVGLYVDPQNCTNFFLCNEDRVPTPGYCLGGKGRFDNVTKTCSAGSCFNCAASGFFADPNDCHSFYACGVNHEPIHSTCTSAGYFDPQRICVIGECPQVNPEPEFTCAAEGYFADPKDCRMYYQCDGSSLTPAYHGICLGGGGYFDEEQEGCMIGKCTSKTKK